MVVVAPPWPYLAQPAAITLDPVAHRLLQARMNKYSLDCGIGCRTPNQRDLGIGEPDRIGGSRSVHQNRWRGELLPFLRGQDSIGHRDQPEIDIQADLMRGMAAAHGTPARLCHVAYQETRPAIGAGRNAQPFDERDQVRMAPDTVAGQAHGLPGRAIDW